MVYTTWGAIDWFRGNVVDLNSQEVKAARSSRDYLYNQLNIIEQNDSSFPRLTGSPIPFGSFARSTKIKPLNDIDVLILLNGYQTQASQSKSDPYTYWLYIKDQSAPLAKFPDAQGYVNSTKILNKFRDSLYKVPNYRKAEIHRMQQAVTLNLSSYPWVFDIVPAVPISDFGNNGTSYFLIPDGNGDWIRTDPRKDQKLVTELNQKLGGNFLPTIRLIKAWNRRSTKPILPSYYFENLAIKVFQQSWSITDFPSAIKFFFECCPAYLYGDFPDPKGLGPNLDVSIPYETKQKVGDAMKVAATYCGYAKMYEGQKDEQKSIYWWGQIFGSEFPTYG